MAEINNMFLINAPAGSGKTTYIENTIISLMAKFPTRKILCITFTNRAKDELNNRIKSKNVVIDTIHSFLSKFIAPYLAKAEVIDLYFEVYEDKMEALISKGDFEPINVKYKEKYSDLSINILRKNICKITYNEQPFSSYYFGQLSHDDILLFTYKMFERFPILRKRLSDKFSYIFIDEYQDTSDYVLQLFYISLMNSNSKLYLLGDKMQEIYENYDGSFNGILKTFRKDINLKKNYRCQSEIVTVLNNLYNDKDFDQEPVIKKYGKPKIIISDFKNLSLLNELDDYLQLYVFNSSKFKKIGVYELYNAVNKMKLYKPPSRYTPADILTKKSNDNPDRLFRILYSICDFINKCEKKSYGAAIQYARGKKQIFSDELVNINTHNDKIVFSNRINALINKQNSKSLSIKEFFEFLINNKYCKKDILGPFNDNEDYVNLAYIPFYQVKTVYEYIDNPIISTQHGVKGESHDKVCFIAEDSKNRPVIHMYSFFELLSKENINLTDFQEFFYSYKRDLNNIDLTYLESAETFKLHKDKYIDYAEKIKETYSENKYFIHCQKEFYDKFLDKPNLKNANECFRYTNVKGTLWAYKLFYVGCSRARKNLLIIVEQDKIKTYKDIFIHKMQKIGFDVEYF